MDKRKNVIVFGGSGFLGSHVADSLTRRGYAVTIFDIKESPYLQESQKMLIGDILDQKQIDDDLEVTGGISSTQAGAPIITSATSITLQAASSSRVHVDQSPLRLYNVSTSNRNNISMADGDLVYDSDINKAYVAQNGSWGQLLTSNGFGYLGAVIEEAGSSSGTSGQIIFFANDYQILRLTQDQTANRTLFISGATGVSFDSSISSGEVRTIAIAWKNGSTPYYINTVQIDGNTQTVKYSGGTAPSAGNANSIDWYTFSIIKTGTAQFEVYGTFTKFA